MQKLTKDIYCDVDNRGDKFVLTADLPGMNKDEISINILDSQIEISAEHKESKEKKIFTLFSHPEIYSLRSSRYGFVTW